MQVHQGLRAAIPLAAFIAGCCQPHHAEPVQPEDPQTAARRGLDKVIASLGREEPNGKLKAKITAHAAAHGADKPIPGLGESFSQILARSTFFERGFQTNFNVANEETIGQVADYLNGPNSPLQDWQGWRYRSGILFDPNHDQKGMEMQRGAAAGAVGTTGSRSIVAVVFDGAGVKQ
jgi:hypothetical protein